MIRSMTGFGRAEGLVGEIITSVEIRSVNGRHFEPNIRLPREWSDKELLVRDLLRGYISRGSVSVFVRLDESQKSDTISLNTDVATQYLAALNQLKTQLGLAGEVTLELLAQNKEIFSKTESDEEKPNPWPELERIVSEAAMALNAMRDEEGGMLKADLLARLLSIENNLHVIVESTKGRTEAERQRLTERVAALMTDYEVDQQRLNMEIVLLAEKYDVAEECVRLESHIKHFREYIDSAESVGRKLNFLLQELHREINTIGSKINDAEIALLVVQMKEDQERMREQIQNVE